MDGWPSSADRAGRVVYVDTHVGRGRHATGELGFASGSHSRLLLDRWHRERLLASCEFVFYFIERDERNLDSLRTEIAGLGALPRRVIVRPHAGDCFSILQVLLGEVLRESGARLAPAFVFVDP